MARNVHPSRGDGVSILAPHSARLRGQIAARNNGTLTIALEQMPIRRPFRFAPGSEVELEWFESIGVMQVTARIGSACDEASPTIEVQLVGEPEPVERREHGRVPVELAVSAWTPAQPTRRLAGATVDVGTGGAQLWLPDLAPFAATLELQIALPGTSVHASSAVRWRREPGLVGVEFERITTEQRARLLDFLRSLP
jgi:hypothetical protein